MNPHISVLTLGVDDIDRAKEFYNKGLGWPIQQDHGQFVSFAPTAGSSALALYPREVLAADAGLSSEGSGYRSFMLSYIVQSNNRVDAVLNEAEAAGATIVKPAQSAQWGGYFGYFADPDGNLWKVVSGRYEVDGVERATTDAFSE